MQEIQMSRKVAAYKIHLDIMAAGEVAAESYSTFCRLLKTMRDDKLWQELEYSSFDAYCENAVGIKQSLAYGYIKAYEDFGDENSNRLEKMGIKKLRLLGTVPKESREEFINEIKPEDLTAKQVETAVKEWKEKLKAKEKELSAKEADLKAEKERAERAVSQKFVAENKAIEAEQKRKEAFKMRDDSIRAFEKDISNLRQQLDQAKRNNDPSKVLELGEKIKEYQQSIDNYQKEIGRQNVEMAELQRQLHEKPIEVASAKIVEEKIIEKAVIPNEVKDAIFRKVTELYEGVLKLTEAEIRIFAESLVFDQSYEVVTEISSAIDVLQGINLVISESIQAT